MNHFRHPIRILTAVLLLAAAIPAIAQENLTNSSIIISTYFPSPNAAFNVMEAKNRTAVGDITMSGDPAIDTIDELQDGQIYVGDSIILGNRTTPPANPVEGMIFYNNTSKQLQFYNGTSWIP